MHFITVPIFKIFTSLRLLKLLMIMHFHNVNHFKVFNYQKILNNYMMEHFKAELDYYQLHYHQI